MPGHLPGNRKVPGSMPSRGFLLLFSVSLGKKPALLPLPQPCTQLLNQENIVYCMCVIRAQLKSSFIADVVITIKKEKNELNALFMPA